jgi:hypothetical protein
MFLLLHDTNNILEILKSKILYKASNIPKIKSFKIGQGSPNRRLATDPCISLKDKKFFQYYDEVDGVYFRLIYVDTPLKIEYGNCIIIVSRSILSDSKFIINTDENNGFCIAEDGVVKESQVGGNPGMSITSFENLKLLKTFEFNPYTSEVVILNDVPIDYIATILSNKIYPIKNK